MMSALADILMEHMQSRGTGGQSLDEKKVELMYCNSFDHFVCNIANLFAVMVNAAT